MICIQYDHYLAVPPERVNTARPNSRRESIEPQPFIILLPRINTEIFGSRRNRTAWSCNFQTIRGKFQLKIPKTVVELTFRGRLF
jgi:hypothetical protein